MDDRDSHVSIRPQGICCGMRFRRPVASPIPISCPCAERTRWRGKSRVSHGLRASQSVRYTEHLARRRIGRMRKRAQSKRDQGRIKCATALQRVCARPPRPAVPTRKEKAAQGDRSHTRHERPAGVLDVDCNIAEPKNSTQTQQSRAHRAVQACKNARRTSAYLSLGNTHTQHIPHAHTCTYAIQKSPRKHTPHPHKRTHALQKTLTRAPESPNPHTFFRRVAEKGVNESDSLGRRRWARESSDSEYSTLNMVRTPALLKSTVAWCSSPSADSAASCKRQRAKAGGARVSDADTTRHTTHERDKFSSREAKGGGAPGICEACVSSKRA